MPREQQKKRNASSKSVAAGEGSFPTKLKALTAATMKMTRPRMTRALAEKLAVGDAKKAPFDGVAFLKSLKK